MWNYTHAQVAWETPNSQPPTKTYTEGPNWKHDCDQCEYLGFLVRHDSYGEVLSPEHDVYLDCGGGTLIIRFGSEGNEYESFPVDIVKNVIMGEEPTARNEKWRCAWNLYRRARG